jgi:hypothetical protein
VKQTLCEKATRLAEEKTVEMSISGRVVRHVSRAADGGGLSEKRQASLILHA